MEPLIQHIPVRRLARFASLGEISVQTETIWIVCHGYAQLAHEFILEFENIVNKKTVVIAPEALNRFYTKGVGGKIGACWMTKEDRQTDIDDYCNYLEELCTYILTRTSAKANVNVLGFSQGGATVSRWVCYTKHKLNAVIFYASTLPPDMEYEANKTKWDAIKVVFIIGDKDEYITETAKEKEIAAIKDKRIKFELMEFKGGHKVYPEVLARIIKLISE